MRTVSIRNTSQPQTPALRAEYCDTFISQFKGLMLRTNLPPSSGLLLVQQRESRLDAAIHMFFMRFDITAVWIDTDFRVVDVRLARKWRPSYVPVKPARYVLETRADYLSNFQIGDQLTITA